MTTRHVIRVGLLALAGTVLAGAVANAQGLADVARQEEARRKTMGKPATKPSKVYTNDNLNPDFTVPTTPVVPGGSPAAGTTAGTAPAASGADKAKPAGDPANMGEDTGGSPNITKVDINDKKEGYWRGRASQIRGAIENARQDVAGLEQRMGSLGGDSSEQKVNAQLLAQARATVVSLQAEWDNFELVAKSANVPDAWIR
jgi:hypothetical protein